jgi:chorismate synthase
MGHFRFLTAGESHGPGLTMVVEGLPAGLPLSELDIHRDLARRQLGYGRGGRMKIESDYAEIRGGVRHGRTLGSPVALWIANRDWANWTEKMAIEPVEGEIERVTRMRPGHADLPGAEKYGFDDVR